MNKSKRQCLQIFKYIASICFLISALFIWSGASNNPQEEESPQTIKLKKVVDAIEIPSQSDLSTYSQTVQDVLRPLAGEAAKTLGTIYVSIAGAGAQDGSSWDNAYAENKLKTAIDTAGTAASTSKPYLILIAGGTYTIGETLNMKDNVAIIGGIDSDWSPAETILDGAGSSKVFRNSSIHSRAVLYGVSIINGKASTSSGSGMFNFNSSPTLIQVIFSNNSAYKGGGMYNHGSSPTLVQVTFSSNTAIINGGGIYNHKSSPILKQVTFSSNSATISGGGIYNHESSPTLEQVTFSNNTATDYGGGMSNYSSSPTLKQVTFSNNRASNNLDTTRRSSCVGAGGGMYNHESSPILEQVTFSNNRTSSKSEQCGGGGMGNYRSSPTLKQVTFLENKADQYGGGIFNHSSSPVLDRVTFLDNEAKNGAGMANYESSSPTLKQVTFSNNKAKDGGGMLNENSSPALKQVTFLNNKAHRGGGMDNGNSSPVLRQVTFSNNKASYGGGMHNGSSSPILMQVTFSNNEADNYGGGGMYNENSSPILMQVTFSNNKAAKDGGGGMYNHNDGEAGPTIINSIFWGNTPNQIYINNDRGNNENLQIYYSILEGGRAGILRENHSRKAAKVNITSYGLVGTEDVKLDSNMADNGGFVQTLALQSGSPAINAGIYIQKSGNHYYYSEDASTWHPAIGPNGLTGAHFITKPDTAVDQTAMDARGYAIVDRPDLGAYEFGAKAP